MKITRKRSGFPQIREISFKVEKPARFFHRTRDTESAPDRAFCRRRSRRKRDHRHFVIPRARRLACYPVRC